ncbi:MAG: MMPL family transporter, partial [Myxococcales bacterium]|nr:MMPL family transporter [Myxococcales bacterium]
EFGVIASYGVVLSMAAAYLVIPPLVFATEKIWPLTQKIVEPKPHDPARAKSGRRWWLGASAFTLIAVIASGFVADQAAFEHDFRNLRDTSGSSTTKIRYGSAIGRGRNTSPSIILGESVEQMRQIHELLAHRYAVEQDPFIKGFITIQTYLPPEQEARMAIIRDTSADPDDPFDRRRRDDIASVVNRSALDRLDGDAREFVDTVRDLVQVEPFGLDEVPPWAIRTLRESDGSIGKVGILFRNVSTWNVEEVQAFQDRYGQLEVEAGTAMVADASFVNADIIRTVKADGLRMGKFVAIILVLMLLASLRSIRGTIICMVTLGAAFFLTLGAMVVTGTKVGMYNMIVLPAVLGVSIDGAIHIYHRYSADGRIGHVMRTTGVAVAAASITTACGFGGLIFQSHMGIQSIGFLAL